MVSSTVEASLKLSFNSKRLADDGRTLLRILALLEGGIVRDDLQTLGSAPLQSRWLRAADDLLGLALVHVATGEVD
jgi:hypothetical protein